MDDFDATPSREDIINAYRLTAGRDPENERVIDERLGQPHREWLPPFFRSGEFTAAVVEPIIRGEPLGGGPWFAQPLPRALAGWAADLLPLETSGRDAARRADDWIGLFGALFADPRFVGEVSGGDGTPNPAFIAALAQRQRLAREAGVVGAIENVTDDAIRGWAVDRRAPDCSLVLELYVDGRFAGATTPDIARPDLDHPGRLGFILRYAAPDHEVASPIGELRDAASGAVIATTRLPGSRRPMLDALAEARHEIAALRSALDRIEARLPDLHHALGFPLSAWDAYAATYYPDRPASNPYSVDAAALIDGRNADIATLDALLASLFAQSARPRTLVLLHDDGDLRIEAEMLVGRWRARFGTATALRGIAAAPDAPRASGLSGVDETHLILCTEPGILAPDAVASLLAAVERGALLAYADDDATTLGDGPRPRRDDPRLRTAFDPDLLLQQDCVGPVAAIVRQDADEASIVGQALRLCEQGASDRIVHVPRVLFHRTTSAAPRPDEHHHAVRAFLARTAPHVTVTPHADRLGAHVPAALSIRRPPPADTRLAIIIPTRDRLDLLAPCLDSIARSLPHNQVSIEVVVVDNRSMDVATHDFLSGYHALPRFRTLAHDGAFNWAAINNRAAAAIEADVLVFLNNDTVVLAPETWDVLAAQALRPGVGAVGARLLYGDGTIQHAGMVTDPWHSFAVHEGTGDAGGEAGYLGRHALVRQVSTVTGACLATRAALFREAGGFDAVAFPFEGNDTDYCLRLRAQGYAVLYDPGATLYHFESRTRGYNDDDAKRRRAAAATRELQARWADAFAQDRFYNPHFDRLARPCTRLAPPPVGPHGAAAGAKPPSQS